MRIFSWVFIILLGFLCESCLEPVVIPVKRSHSRLVVDGMITNEAGPHQVTLKFSQPADAVAKDAMPVTGAQVRIIENDQDVISLTETEPGLYLTDSAWIPAIGNIYQLRIRTNEQEYYSVPQKMMDPGNIDDLYVRFEEDGFTFGTDGAIKQDAINVYINGSNQAGTPLRWRFVGRFHARTFPELRIIDSPGGPIPNPPPCSGYINYFNELVKVGECTCCECYPFDYLDRLSITETSFKPDHTHREVLVAKIPARPLRFINRYYIEVEQFSVSDEVHAFWRMLKKLHESAGSIFQPNSVKVRGNMRSANSEKEVFGVFAVSGVVKATLFVDSTVFPYRLVPEILTEECDHVFSNATYDKPSFWP